MEAVFMFKQYSDLNNKDLNIQIHIKYQFKFRAWFGIRCSYK